jgi:hypothetical protein
MVARSLSLVPRISPPNRRSEIRHRVSIGCAIEREHWRLFVGQALDLSPDGMLIRCEARIDPGSGLIVSFKTTELGVRFVTRATVTRVVLGRRRGDEGRAVGVRFVGLSAVSRLVLRGMLHAFPPAPALRAPPPRLTRMAGGDVDYASVVDSILAEPPG